MKVILLKDIPKLGRKYDIKEVNDGHAINMLIPKKLVEPATPKRLAEIEKMKRDVQIERGIEEEALAKSIAELNEVNLIINSKANEHGHLFSSITKDTISESLKGKKNININPNFIVLDKPIKEIGEYNISVKTAGKNGSFKLSVRHLDK